MNDNLKTWPEKIYFQACNEDEAITGNVTWCSERMNDDDVGYIHADIVKEREDRLIKIAYVLIDRIFEHSKVECEGFK